MAVTMGLHSYGVLQVMGVAECAGVRVVRYEYEPDIQIGNYCSIASGAVFLYGGEHHREWVTTSGYPVPYVPGGLSAAPPKLLPIRVGNDVWIGLDAMIMCGVTIGDGAVVGARALVRKDVPPYAVVAGVPARVRRWRFLPEQIAALLRIRWWDWPEARVQRYAALLLSPDVDAFIQAARQEPL